MLRQSGDTIPKGVGKKKDIESALGKGGWEDTAMHCG